MIERFNIRVYGLVVRDNTVLVSDEHILGEPKTKFPGGGLELGEGLRDGLKREFQEELDARISIHSHFYTTDFFQQSAYREEDQIISVYYKVLLEDFNPELLVENKFDFQGRRQVFRWMKLAENNLNNLDFPIDKHVFKKVLKSQ